MNIIKFIGLIIALIFILFLFSHKMGVEATFSKAIKLIPPICIILFYLLDISIIKEVLKCLKITNDTVTQSKSIMVAIDSAIITLILNTLFDFFSTPISAKAEMRSVDNMDSVLLDGDRGKIVSISASVNFRSKLVKAIFRMRGGLRLRIVNSKWTSIQIENEKQYGEVIDASISSKYIDIIFGNISDKKVIDENLFLRMSVSSKKKVSLDDEIHCEIVMSSSIIDKILMMFCDLKSKPIKICLRKEKDD